MIKSLRDVIVNYKTRPLSFPGQDRLKKDLERLTAKWSILTDELDDVKKTLAVA